MLLTEASPPIVKASKAQGGLPSLAIPSYKMGEMLSEDIRAEPLGLTTNFLVTEAHLSNCWTAWTRESADCSSNNTPVSPGFTVSATPPGQRRSLAFRMPALQENEIQLLRRRQMPSPAADASAELSCLYIPADWYSVRFCANALHFRAIANDNQPFSGIRLNASAIRSILL